VTVIEAMKEALEFLEALGYTRGGDIHDNLEKAIRKVDMFRVSQKEIGE
jgi:hypothetical protein